MRAFIIVTVKDKDGRINYDMELPTDVPAAQLAGDIAEAVSLYNRQRLLPEGCALSCERLGQALPGGKTLGELGVWTGDILIIGEAGR